MENKINVEELYYPSAIEWMWNYCHYLGPFTDSRGNNYDLGIYIDKSDGHYSGAIVFGNTPGDYYSGQLIENNKHDDNPERDWYEEKYRETYSRAKKQNLINPKII